MRLILIRDEGSPKLVTMYKELVKEMELKDFTYNTPVGELQNRSELITTAYWANGCRPSQNGYNPTFEEVGQTKTVGTPLKNWMVDLHVKGVDNSGYLVGKITRIWREESFHPDNFQ